MKLYLASASPRRRELLGQIGLEFEVRVSNVQEEVTASEPARVVEELSARKARAVFADLEQELRQFLVIGADTVVAADGRILGKPADSRAAAEMLAMLSGRSHEVFTGVTVIGRTSAGQIREKTFHERTEVVFYAMSRAEIAGYVSTGDCLDKAGAYGIQGLFARYVKEIKGDYNNVVGLPVGRLYQEMKDLLEA